MGPQVPDRGHQHAALPEVVRGAVPVHAQQLHAPGKRGLRPGRRRQLQAEAEQRHAAVRGHPPAQRVGAGAQRLRVRSQLLHAVGGVVGERVQGRARKRLAGRVRGLHARRHLLGGVERGAGMGGEVVRHLVEVQEDRRRNAAGSRFGEIAVVQQEAVVVAVDDTDRGCAGRGVRAGCEALPGARQLERETGLRRRRPIFPAGCAGAQDPARLLHGVAHAAAALRGHHQQAVGDRLAQVVRDRRQSQPHAVQAPDTARVAVGVVAGGGGDGHGAAEVVAAEQQGGQHHRVVGLYRARPGEDAVAVAGIQPLPYPAPVVLAGADAAHVVQQPAELVAGRERLGRVQQRVQRAVLEGQRLQRPQVGGTVERHSVVTDRRRLADQRNGLARVAGRHQRQRIGEDLGADLRGEHRPVERAAPALRGAMAGLQTEVGRVLGGAAESAPPEDGLVLDDGVEPRVAEVRRRDLAIPSLLHGAEEAEAAGQVVVGDHQRLPERLVHVAIDLAEPFLDGIVRPALHGPPQVDADHLAEHAGVGRLGEPLLPSAHGPSPPLRAARSTRNPRAR